MITRRDAIVAGMGNAAWLAANAVRAELGADHAGQGAIEVSADDFSPGLPFARRRDRLALLATEMRRRSSVHVRFGPGEYLVPIERPGDALAVPDGAVVALDAAATLRLEGWGIPLFVFPGSKGATLTGGRLVTAAKVRPDLPFRRGEFERAFGPTKPAGDRDYLAPVLAIGTTDLRIEGLACEAAEPVAELAAHGWIICHPATDGSRATGTTIRDCRLDDGELGILAWGQERMHISNIRSSRYAQGQQSWNADGHLIYISTAVHNQNVVIENIEEYGLFLGNQGERRAMFAVNFRGISNGVMRRVRSRRPHGLFSIFATENCLIEDCEWNGQARPYLGQTAPIHMPAKPSRRLTMRDVRLLLPENITYPALHIAGEGPVEDSMIEVTVELEGCKGSAPRPLASTRLARSSLRLRVNGNGCNPGSKVEVHSLPGSDNKGIEVKGLDPASVSIVNRR